MKITILYARETDGRIIAEIPELPGVLAYGATRLDAKARVMALGREIHASQQAKESEPAPEAPGLRATA